MKLCCIQDANLKGKKVVLRVDFNVPLKNGKITDDTRIVQTLPTIQYLLKKGAKVIIMSHLGRPDGKVKKDLRLDPIAKYLSKLLKKPVKKLDDCIGPKITKAAQTMKPGEIILLENVRFHKEEEKNNLPFAKKLASLGEIYVSDSFGTTHRAHASTAGIAKYLPSYAGLLIQKEVKMLSGVLEKGKHPMTLIVGGAKIDTKIGLISNFIVKADYFLLGGGLANTFLAASGFDVGKSLYEPNKIDVAQQTMLEAESFHENFVLPEDVIVADKIGDKVPTADIPVEDVVGNMKILDIGHLTAKKFMDIIKKSKIIIWNGPVGLYECKPFSKGTAAVAWAVAKAKGATTIIGGGDTIDAIKHFGFQEKHFTHVSTGGGAMLEFLQGDMLPGIEVLIKKN